MAFALVALVVVVGEPSPLAKPPPTDEIHQKVSICGAWVCVLEHYPNNAFGRSKYDEEMIEHCNGMLTGELWKMCNTNAVCTPLPWR